MPYRPPDYDPREPDKVVWDYLLSNKYEERKFRRRKTNMAARRRQLSRDKQVAASQKKIHRYQNAAMLREIQRMDKDVDD